MKPKRVNFAALAAMMCALAAMSAFNHDYWIAAASLASAIFMLVVHLIRVRRFKRYDQAHPFE